MDSVFFQAMLVQPAVILGRQLKPFSAWHMLVLLQFDSPLLLDDLQHATPEAVIFALYVCGLSFGDGGEAIMRPDTFLKDAEAWGRRLEDPDIAQAAIDFRTYRHNYARLPQLWSQEGKTSQSSIPMPFKMVATVLSRVSGISELAAWDMPLNRLACYRASVAEDNGIDVVLDRIQKIIDGWIEDAKAKPGDPASDEPKED